MMYDRKLRETSFTTAKTAAGGGQLQRPALRAGMSLDQGKLLAMNNGSDSFTIGQPKRMEMLKRPPLVHSNCFDQSTGFEFTGKLASRGCGYKQQPKPLSAEEASSTRIEEETMSMIGSTKYLSKSDECCLLDVVQKQNSSSLDSSDKDSFSVKTVNNNNNNNKMLKAQFSIDLADSVNDTYERSYKNRANEYFYERAVAGPSNIANQSSETGDEIGDGNTSSPPTQTTALIHHQSNDNNSQSFELLQQFRPNRLQGISFDHVRVPPKLIKQNRVQKLSSSSLQQVPTTTATTIKETSLSRLFDKRFGRKNNRLEKSKRLSTSALYDDAGHHHQSPTEALHKSKSGSGRLSSVQLFEKFCSEDFSSLYGNSDTTEEDDTEFGYYDNPTTSKSEDSVPHFSFYENPLERASVTALYERFCYDSRQSSSTSRETASSLGGVVRKTAIRDQDDNNDVFTFDSPPHHQHQQQPFSGEQQRKPLYSDIYSEINTPALSRGSETETSFNDDFISSFNDDFFISSLNDDNMLMSPNLETLIEDRIDDESDKTPLYCGEHEPTDKYEPCFGVSLQPKRRSIKNEMLPNFKDRSWDLSNLDLRPIDDDDDSDSQIVVLANIDETDSIGVVAGEDPATKLNNSVMSSSRSSMQKLQPFCLKRTAEDIYDDEQQEQQQLEQKQEQEQVQPEPTSDQTNINATVAAGDKLASRLSIEPTTMVKVATQVAIKSDKSVFFRVGRDKQTSAVTVHRKTKCFPL